ncbi:MAG: leucine-rich repeat protein, partial [Clostridiales bacterium]|nr:leucine-rich repeat protein [Clostridiales bacterium]
MDKMKDSYRRLLKKTGACALTAAMMVSLVGSMGAVAANAESGDVCGNEEAQVGALTDAAVLGEDFLTTDLEGDDSVTATVPEGYEADEQGKIQNISAGVLFTYDEDTEAETDDITWSLSDSGVLTISGTGAMTDYTSSNYPEWYTYRTQITSVIVEEGVTDLGNRAFYNCTKLTDVSLPESLQSMGRTTFADCTSLKTINIPSSVTELEYAVFADCTSLTSISLDSIQTIGDYVFQETTISEMVIPASVTSISSLAFFDSEIEAFSVNADNSVYTEKDGVIYADNGATLFAYPQGNSAESFTVPDGVTAIGDRSFYYAKNLETVEISSSVTSLGESAFQNMYKMTEVTIPDSVTEVGMFTFYGCPALTSVTFGNGLTITGYQMFRNCTALTDIAFGDTLSELYAHTFAYCTSLKEVTLPANIKTIGNGCFGFCSSLTSVTTEGLEGIIPYQSFCVCTSLTNLSLNEGVTEIAREAFYGCSSLTQVTLPASMEFVYFSAFPTTTVITNKNTELKPYGANGYRYLEDVSISGEYNYDMAYEVLELVNEEREAEGLSALVMDESLLETAMQRGSEIALLFSHTRPDGSPCFSANSAMNGENVAAGQTSASAVMESWMNSEGHKANILTSSYTTVGIGCFYHNGVYYWVQNFGVGDTATDCDKPENESVTKTVSLAVGEFEEPITSTGIYWGSLESYTYEYSLDLTVSDVQEGETSQASVYIQNPGFDSASALLENDGITYTSSDTDVATVSTNGLITGVSEGQADIIASLKYNEARENILVYSLVASDDSYYGTTISMSDIAVTNTSEGIQVTFDAVEGANYYDVTYQYTSSASIYGKLLSRENGDINDDLDSYTTIITDCAEHSGEIYTVYVEIRTSTSKLTTNTVTIMYLSQPVLSISGSRSNPTVKWETVNGAESYQIYRRTEDSDWIALESTTETRYTDTTADTETVYYYTVQAVSGYYRSSSDTEGVCTSQISASAISGADTLVVRRDGNIYYFSDSITNPDAGVTKVSYGRSTDEVLVGDWDGDGIDTLAVRRN